MALTYSQMATQSIDAGFQGRVEFALLQVAANNKLQATPTDPSVTTLAALEDRLARAIIGNPVFWAAKFATLTAIQLIGKTTLLDPAVTTDGDIFSAVSAVYGKFLI